MRNIPRRKAAIGDVNHRLIRPVCLVKIKRVLLDLPIISHQPLVIPAKMIPLMSPIRREIEHAPEKSSPQILPLAHRLVRRLVNDALPFFRMPEPIRLRLARIHFVLKNARPRPIFADGQRALRKL